MVLDVALCSTKRFGIRRSAAAAGRQVALVDPLHDQGAARLLEEFVVKPARQAAHLDARAAFGRQEAALRRLGAVGLVKIFGDHASAGNRGHTLFDENRRGSGRIDHQELGPALPYPLFDELWRQTVFLQHEAHEAGMWTNRMVEQRQHCATSLGSDLGSNLAEKSALPHDLSRIVLTKKP